MVERIESSDHATGSEAPADPNAVTIGEDGRPSNVPEKFWNAETKSVNQDALLQSYVELEKSKEGGLPSDSDDPDPTPKEPAADDDPVKEKAEADAVSAGVDMTSLEEEFMREGKLTDESRDGLKAKGYSDEDIDGFIEYRVSKGERYTAELHDAVGGADKFDKMAAWASENWNEDDLKEYNNAVESQNMSRAKMAMKGLRADFEKANGSTPKLLSGDGGATQAGSVYRSDAEMHKDMQDLRYRDDPAYRQDVMNKVERTQKSLGQT